RTSEVIVIRQSPNNSFLVIPVDVEKVIDGTDTGQNITLLPFDVVYVPKSRIANVNQ
ncbi:MAG: sugar transporter, partial [Candidatus Latescibacteria bacterium]|nr:sugar transporter [Candidatus Latescibacterota bacterium]